MVDQARGHRESKLVGVAHAVRAVKPVFAKQRVKGKIVQAGIEYRQVVLVFLGDIEIEQAWFQGLDERRAEERRIAFEKDAAVHADHGQNPARARLVQRALVLQAVLGVAQSGLWYEKRGDRVDRETDAGEQVEPEAVGIPRREGLFPVAFEIADFASESVVEPAVSVW